ncbi:hypothetical protein ACXAT3_001119 [Clostridium sporogenes]
MRKCKLCIRVKRIYANNKELFILTILGFMCLIHIFLTVFFYKHYSSGKNTLDSVIRSQMSLIFGYIFGLQTMGNSNIANKNFQFVIASSVALISLTCLILARWFNALESTVAIASVRDMLVSSTGFIVGHSKNKDE